RCGRGQAGRALGEIRDGQHPIAIELLATEHGNRDRNVLRALGPVACGDDDFGNPFRGRGFLSLRGSYAEQQTIRSKRKASETLKPHGAVLPIWIVNWNDETLSGRWESDKYR